MKTRCAIVYCPRWSRRFSDDEEWICGGHWKFIPRRMRAVWRRARLRAIKAEAALDEPEARRAFPAAARVWRRMVREATEVAVGIRARRP